MAGSEYTRRRFIQHAGASGTLLVFGFALAPVSGCGEEPCRDLSDLSSDEIEWREESGYVDQTPNPAQRCDNCEFWEPPRGDTPCGGCTVMAGPIAPGAYCDLWEASA